MQKESVKIYTMVSLSESHCFLVHYMITHVLQVEPVLTMHFFGLEHKKSHQGIEEIYKPPLAFEKIVRSMEFLEQFGKSRNDLGLVYRLEELWSLRVLIQLMIMQLCYWCGCAFTAEAWFEWNRETSFSRLFNLTVEANK